MERRILGKNVEYRHDPQNYYIKITIGEKARGKIDHRNYTMLPVKQKEIKWKS